MAVVAVTLLGMTAAAISFRGGGRWAAAAVATAGVIIGLVAPWERLLLLAGDRVRRVQVWWPELGTSALTVAGGCVLLLAILWWSLLRRSPRGRLLVLIGSLLLAAALVALPEAVELDPREWMPVVEQGRCAMMDYRIETGKQVLDGSLLLLPVAVILAYAAPGDEPRRCGVDRQLVEKGDPGQRVPSNPCRLPGRVVDGPATGRSVKRHHTGTGAG